MPMNITGKKVAILVDDYFEQSEFEFPLQKLREAGANVTVIGAQNMELHGMHHADKTNEFTADARLSEVADAEYDALVLPGGALNADTLRTIPEAQAWVRTFLLSRRPLAVICHAPWVLVSAGVLKGRRVTSYHTIHDDIQNAGGEWVDQPVVVDDTLITSRGPDDLPMFTESLIAMLAQQTPAEESDEVIPPEEALKDDELATATLQYPRGGKAVDEYDDESRAI